MRLSAKVAGTFWASLPRAPWHRFMVSYKAPGRSALSRRFGRWWRSDVGNNQTETLRRAGSGSVRAVSPVCSICSRSSGRAPLQPDCPRVGWPRSARSKHRCRSGPCASASLQARLPSLSLAGARSTSASMLSGLMAVRRQTHPCRLPVGASMQWSAFTHGCEDRCDGALAT